MKVAYLYVPGFSGNEIFKNEGRKDGQNSFFIQLKQAFLKKRILLSADPSAESVSIVNIYFDPEKHPVGRSVCVLWEHPAIVGTRSISYLRKFTHVLAWHRKYLNADIRPVFYLFPTPDYDSQLLELSGSSDRNPAICIINSNKFSPKFSFYEGYSQRLRIIVKLNSLGCRVDLYGMQWDVGPRAVIPYGGVLSKLFSSLNANQLFKRISMRHFKGTPISKSDVLHRYTFCLVVENYIAENYITEKIFDSMASGAIPIYLGAPNIESFVPKECFINASKFKNIEALSIFVKQLGPADIEQYRYNALKFIKQFSTGEHSSIHFAEKIVFQMLGL